MGNKTCCAAKDAGESAQADMDAVPVGDGSLRRQGSKEEGLPGFGARVPTLEDFTYKVTLRREAGTKLGMDVDYLAPRRSLPIMAVTPGLAQTWNASCAEDRKIKMGDSIIEVNGIRGDIAGIMSACKGQTDLEITLVRSMNYDCLVDDLEKLMKAKGCGPIMVRLSWHDAGVFSQGALTGGCPNAALRLPGGGEGQFPANAGLRPVALALLEPISNKYCPYLVSHADLWALAANIAIRIMGGPDIPTRFGRVDAERPGEGVQAAEGRLPDAARGAAHLREVFHPKGFDDKAIVALSGAHTVGRCHLDRSGYEGAWTEEPLRFDNAYFANLLSKSYQPQTSSKGCPQFMDAASGTMMLPSDMALVSDPAFKAHVERYAKDRAAFFNDFTEAWTKLQENGCANLRDLC